MQSPPFLGRIHLIRFDYVLTAYPGSVFVVALVGCELIIVAFRSAKDASVNAPFAEQKATLMAALSIYSQPIRAAFLLSFSRITAGNRNLRKLQSVQF